MMPVIIALVLAGGLAAAGAPQAAETVTRFADLQTACVSAGSIRFGPGSRWPTCRLTGSRWVTTIGDLDFYQAQYCLGGDEGCARRAQVIYANKAYTPEARVLLQRIDPANAEYAAPLVLTGAEGTHLVLKVTVPGAAAQRQYYRWQQSRWTPVSPGRRLRDLAASLP